MKRNWKAYAPLCDAPCSESSSLAGGGDLPKLLRKSLSVALMFIASYAAINIGIAHGRSGCNSLIDLHHPILEVGTAQSELSHNLSDRLIERGSRSHSSVCSVRVDQSASPLSDDPAELPAADLGFSVKDSLAHLGVPRASEDMSGNGSNNDPDQRPEHVCPWCEGRQVGIVHQIGYHVFVLLAAMGIGFPLIYWLVHKDFFLPNVKARAPLPAAAHVDHGVWVVIT
jgi:hypothetical protein